MDKQADPATSTRLSVSPFVCLYDPFVCHSESHSLPLVFKKQPLVGIRGVLGFTLTELMATLIILAILAGAAIPSMRSFILDGRIKSQTDDLAAALNIGRSEAVKISSTVSIKCLKSDGTDCTGTDWANGWVAWVDTDAALDVDSSERTLRNMGTTQSDITITASIPTDASLSVTSLQFRSNGENNKGKTFQFLVCDTKRSGETGRKIEISAIGRVSVTEATCG